MHTRTTMLFEWPLPASGHGAQPGRGMVRAQSDSTAAIEDPDLALVERMASGEQTALVELMQRHGRRLHAAVASLLNDPVEAEDVCQEAFIQAWRHAATWQSGRARFSSWLHQVALNGGRDRLRRRRPQVPVDPDWQADPGAGPDHLLASDRRSRDLRQALAQLPPRQREAIALFHQGGLSQAEAAAAMEISEEALESLLARARRQLRQQLRAVEDARPSAQQRVGVGR